jgi:hypothetical protein
MRPKMSWGMFLALMGLVAVAGLAVDWRGVQAVQAGELSAGLSADVGYKVLDPIRHGNLTVFPVVSLQELSDWRISYAG